MTLHPTATIHCTLCEQASTLPLDLKNESRIFYYCASCNLIFVDARFHLSKEAERSRYELHQNDKENNGYVTFLKRVIEPVLPLLTPDKVLLDYGCGPVPTLAAILKEQQLTCFNYDPIFNFTHPHTAYDFIFTTECMEHFYYPKRDIAQIDSLIKPGGFLGIMTERWGSLDQFNTWYYKRDKTHVSFYHETSFDYICKQYRYTIYFTDHKRVIVLQKST